MRGQVDAAHLSAHLLKDRLIGLTELFLAFLLPLPFLVRWCWLCVVRYRRCGGAFPPAPDDAASVPLGPEAKSVIETLQGPFKDSESRVFGSICGQGMLIGRRLVLVLLYTFVNNTLMRTQCTMLLCFVNLLHHVRHTCTRAPVQSPLRSPVRRFLGTVRERSAGPGRASPR